ncbi:MAG TPA: hypothetical protein VIX20_18540 [Ktedonobacteraceae bacterium]
MLPCTDAQVNEPKNMGQILWLSRWRCGQLSGRRWTIAAIALDKCPAMA